MHLPGNLTDGTGFHRQHRTAVALSNHRVLQCRAQPPEQLLKLVATLLPQPLPLLSQSGQRSTGAIRHPAPVFEGELQTLLKLGERDHRFHQSGGHGAYLRFIDLPPQSPCRRQGLGHSQKLLS